MERLTNPAYLVPSSMSGGSEWHGNDLAMTAPGSQGIAPEPVGLVETLPLPVDSMAADSNVNQHLVGPGGEDHGGDPMARQGGGWHTFGDGEDMAGWVQQ